MVDCNDARKRPVFFWKEAFKHVLHSMQMGLVPMVCHHFHATAQPAADPRRHKSRGQQNQRPVDGWVPLRRDCRAWPYDGVLHVFRSPVFPRKQDPKSAAVSLAPGESCRRGLGRSTLASPSTKTAALLSRRRHV